MSETRDKDSVAAIVRERGRGIKIPDTVMIGLLKRVVDDHELTGRVDGVGGDRQGRIYGRGAHSV